MITFKSGLSKQTSLMRVRMISVCNDLSCASSTIIAEYDFRSGSYMNYRSSIPSVMYLIIVF